MRTVKTGRAEYKNIFLFLFLLFFFFTRKWR
jgi:hypothetical protein